jgi:hypothetical protein
MKYQKIVSLTNIHLFIFFCFANTSFGQIIINEASSDNGTLYNQTNIDYADFIEIKNTTNATVNLLGWYLSDDAAQLTKWPFFATSIAANSLKVVLADNKNYFNWQDTFLHTNFKIKNSGQTIYLSNATVLVDSIVVPQLELNQSVGKPFGQNTGTVFFNSMTPGYQNTTLSYSGLAASPFVNKVGGFFSTPIYIKASCPIGQTVLYTTDGENPRIGDTVFPDSLLITNTTPVKYRCKGTNLLLGNIISETYLINESQSIAIISITTDSVNLWDSVYGAWMLGIDPTWPANNVIRHLRRAAKVEFFANGQKQFGKDVGIETDGGSSITEPKHTLNIDFEHTTFGSDKINYKIFSKDKDNATFKSLKIRAGGNQYVHPVYGGGILYTDAIAQRLAKHLHVPYSAYVPATVFLNGHYFGLFEVREKTNDDFFKYNYGINPDSIDISEKGNLDGQYPIWHNLVAYLDSATNKTSPAFLDTFKKSFDYENYIDYFCHELHFQNKDWQTLWYANNIKWCRYLMAADKKYRYMLYDYDAAFCDGVYPFNALDNLLHVACANWHSNVFRAIIKNQKFQYDFANRYADLVNLYWQQDTVQSVFDKMNNEVQNEISNECNRWSSFSTVAHWQTDFALKRSCIVDRNIVARNELDSLVLGKSGQVNITLDVYPSGAGKVHISTIDAPTYPWMGIYFKGAPVSIKAIANAGYVFDHWDANAFINNVFVDSFNNNITNNTTCKAYFKQNNVGIALVQNAKIELNIYPNPAQHTIQINANTKQTAMVKILDLSQKIMLAIPNYKQGNTIDISRLSAGVYLISFNNKEMNCVQKLIVQ